MWALIAGLLVIVWARRRQRCVEPMQLGGNRWIEEGRGNRATGSRPPCIEYSATASKVHDLVGSLDYRPMLEAMSMLLCQKKYVHDKYAPRCLPDMLAERIRDMKRLGASPSGALPIAQQFVHMATQVINAQMRRLNKDSRVSKAVRARVAEVVRLFTTKEVPGLAQACEAVSS